MLMNIWAAIVILISLPFRAAIYLAKHRALLVCAVILIIGIAAYNTVHKPKAPDPSAIPVAYYQKIEPSIEKAPQVIQTVEPDRVYYLMYKIGQPHELAPGEAVTLTANKYFMYNKKKWEVGTLPLPLIRDNYRNIWIYSR